MNNFHNDFNIRGLIVLKSCFIFLLCRVQIYSIRFYHLYKIQEFWNKTRFYLNIRNFGLISEPLIFILIQIHINFKMTIIIYFYHRYTILQYKLSH